MGISDYTESKIKSIHGYKENSYSRSEYSTYIVIRYKTLIKELKQATEAGAGYGSMAGGVGGGTVAGPLGVPIFGAIGAAFGALGGLIHGAINPVEYSYEYYFDKDSGNYLGSNQNEAANGITRNGLNKFTAENFQNALNYFNDAHSLSTDGSMKNELIEKIEISEIMVKNVTKAFGSFDARNNLKNAYERSSDAAMKSTIKVFLNQLAENFNTTALNYLQQENWSLAEKFFDHAVKTKNFTDDKKTPNQYENSKNIATIMKSINSNNEIEKLTEILPQIQSSIMYSLVFNMLKGKKLYKEATQKLDEAWNLENDDNDDRSSEASESFDKAKEIIQETSSFVSQNKTYANFLSAISLKITGNNSFNEAIDMQEEANRLKSKDKYLEAMEKFQSACNYFKDGLAISSDNRFQSNITLTETQIDHIAYIIRSLNFSNLPVIINHPNVEIDVDHIDIDHTIVVD